MKLLLTKDVSGLGRTGDIKEVSDGHARNFLIPKGLALPATSGMLAKVQKETQEKQNKVAREQERIQQLKNRLSQKEFIIEGKASGGKLFAAIHEKEIVAAINKKFPNSVNEDQIKLPKPIKTVGESEVGINLSDTVIFKVRIIIKPI